MYFLQSSMQIQWGGGFEGRQCGIGVREGIQGSGTQLNKLTCE